MALSLQVQKVGSGSKGGSKVGLGMEVGGKSVRIGPRRFIESVSARCGDQFGCGDWKSLSSANVIRGCGWGWGGVTVAMATPSNRG